MEQKDHFINHIVRPPALPPPRIELNILQSHYTRGVNVAEPEIDGYGNACPLCPDTSSRNIPSMVYDAIKCPHHFIQPAQDAMLTHPWSANTCGRQMQSRGLSPTSSLQTDDLSFFSDKNETLPPPSPVYYPVAKTAPPRRNMYNDVRKRPPYTAPVKHSDGQWDKKPGSVDQYGGEGHNFPVREFEGKYFDPKDGSVYNYKIRYGKKPAATRRLLSGVADSSKAKDLPRNGTGQHNINDAQKNLERVGSIASGNTPHQPKGRQTR